MFKFIIRNESTTEIGQMIYSKAVTESYNERINDGIIWIRRTFNLADAMTNQSIFPQLVKVIGTVKLYGGT